MLFDLGWSEILVIGTVALIFIGPKDLPKALRVAGYWVRKARTLSREFQNSIDQMIREAELDEMRQELKKAAEFDLDKEFQNTVDPTGSLAEALKPPGLPDFSQTVPFQPSAANVASGETTTAQTGGGAPPPPESEAAPVVAASASEPDQAVAATPTPRPEPADRSFAPPKP